MALSTWDAVVVVRWWRNKKGVWALAVWVTRPNLDIWWLLVASTVVMVLIAID